MSGGKSSWQFGAVGAVFAAGVALSLLLGSKAAAFGVSLAVLTSFFALFMKGWAVRKGLDAAFLVVGASFGVRLFTVGAACAVAYRFDAILPLVLGFFGAFLPLLIIEMAYVLRVSKSLQPSTSGSTS